MVNPMMFNTKQIFMRNPFFKNVYIHLKLQFFFLPNSRKFFKELFNFFFDLMWVSHLGPNFLHNYRIE